MYVSITGLRLKSILHTPRFIYHAIPSMMQARAAEGNLLATSKNVNGVQHTLSVWKDRKSMLKFLRSGDHAKAMRSFDDIATGKTYGYEIESEEDIPTWDEAVELYNTKGKEYGKEAREKRAAERRSHAAAPRSVVGCPE